MQEDKHHSGLAPAGSDVSPRESADRSLPIPSCVVTALQLLLKDLTVSPFQIKKEACPVLLPSLKTPYNRQA